jgi:hypothetical protein
MAAGLKKRLSILGSGERCRNIGYPRLHVHIPRPVGWCLKGKNKISTEKGKQKYDTDDGGLRAAWAILQFRWLQDAGSHSERSGGVFNVHTELADVF